jgi:hypothetical protein
MRNKKTRRKAKHFRSAKIYHFCSVRMNPCRSHGRKSSSILYAFINNLAKEANVKRNEAEKFIKILLQN